MDEEEAEMMREAIVGLCCGTLLVIIRHVTGVDVSSFYIGAAAAALILGASVFVVTSHD